MVNNPDLRLLLDARLNDLRDETMSLSQPDEVMQAHKEHQSIRDFADWIYELGTPTENGR